MGNSRSHHVGCWHWLTGCCDPSHADCDCEAVMSAGTAHLPLTESLSRLIVCSQSSTQHHFSSNFPALPVSAAVVFHTSWMLFQTLSQQCGCTEGITRYTTVLCKAMNKPFPSTFWSSYYSNLVQSNTNAHCHKATRQLVWLHLMAGLTQVYEIYGYTSVVVLIVQSVKIQSNQCSSTELLQSGLGSPKQNLWGILRTASSQAGHCYCCSANSVKALTPTTENYHRLFLREWTYRSLHYGGSLTLEQQQQLQLATKQWAKKTQTNWWNASRSSLQWKDNAQKPTGT